MQLFFSAVVVITSVREQSVEKRFPLNCTAAILCPGSSSDIGDEITVKVWPNVATSIAEPAEDGCYQVYGRFIAVRGVVTVEATRVVEVHDDALPMAPLIYGNAIYESTENETLKMTAESYASGGKATVPLRVMFNQSRYRKFLETLKPATEIQISGWIHRVTDVCVELDHCDLAYLHRSSKVTTPKKGDETASESGTASGASSFRQERFGKARKAPILPTASVNADNGNSSPVNSHSANGDNSPTPVSRRGRKRSAILIDN